MPQPVHQVHLQARATGCVDLAHRDPANHAQEGIFITTIPFTSSVSCKNPYSIFDIAPTVLDYFDIPVPPEMIGESLFAGDIIGSQPEQLADKLKALSGEMTLERRFQKGPIPGAGAAEVNDGTVPDDDGFADTGD